MRHLASLLAILSTVVPASAVGADEAYGVSAGEGGSGGASYLAFRAGAVLPKDSDLEGFDNGLGLEAAIGFHSSERVAFEAGVARYSLGATQSGYANVGGYLYPASLTVDLAAYALTGTAKLFAPVEKARFYALVGAGLYFVTADASMEIQGYPSQGESGSEPSLGIHVGGGIDLEVTPRVRVGGELKYIMGEVDVWDTGTANGYDSLSFGAAITYAL